MKQADQLTSYQRAAETKRQRTINEIVGTAAVEFYRHGYKGVTIQTIAEHSTRSAATFYNAAERKSRLGLMVIDTVFQGVRSTRPIDTGPAPHALATAIQDFISAVESVPEMHHALAEELAAVDGSLRVALPDVARTCDEAIRLMATDRELPHTDVMAMTDQTIALVGALLTVPELEASIRDQLVDTYLARLSTGNDRL